MAMSERDHYNQRLSALKTEFSTWQRHYMDIADYLLPRASRFLVFDRNQGNKRNPKINDCTATLASRVLSAGFMSSATNPTKPWFQYKTEDPDLNKWHKTRAYLDTVRKAVSGVMLKSNLYTVLPMVYQDISGFATSAFEIFKDDQTTARCYHYPVGSYYLGLSGRLMVDSIYRNFQMTTSQLVGMFGYNQCSLEVRGQYDTGAYDQWHTVVRVMEPNPDYQPGSITKKPMRSIYYEQGSEPDKYLRKAGFDSNPLIAPRWEVTGEDSYGSNCPGMVALGDIMALQLEQRRKVTVIDKHVNPPTSAPTSLEKKGTGVSNLPGGVTYIDVMTGQQGIQTTYQTQLGGMQYLLEDIREVQGRIDSAFYKDLFLLVSSLDREATATEIMARQEEKLLALGPAYLRLNDEALDPIVGRYTQIVTDKSRPYWEGRLNGSPIIPPPPPELVGKNLMIEYISPMSQAMKAIGINSIERTMTFAGGLMQEFPEIRDNFNADNVITVYSDMNGTPPELFNDEAVRDQIRAARAQQAQAEAASQQAASAANTAKTLSQSNVSDNNALAQLLGRMQTPQQAAPGGGA